MDALFFCGGKMKHFDVSKFNLSYNQYVELIDQWIFSEVDRHLLKRKLLDGISFEKLAEEVELSVTQTKTRLYKAEKILFAVIQK